MSGRANRSKLDRLPAETQAALLKACQKGTLVENAQRLKNEHGFSVGPVTLSKWLQKKNGTLNVLGTPRKQHPKNPLTHLSPDKREIIYEQCERMSAKRSVTWLKKEYGVEIKIDTLKRWLQRRRREKELEVGLDRIRRNAINAKIVCSMMDAAAAMTRANQIHVGQLVFEEFSKPEKDRDEKRLMTMLALAIKTNSGVLAEDKFHYEAARMACEKAGELCDINAGSGSEEEKMKKAMELLFGPEPQVDVTTMTDEECDAALAGQTEETQN